MTTLSFTGNLTANPLKKQTQNQQPYYLLQVAENIRKRERGAFIKDAKGHFVTVATYFHSVFVFNPILCSQIQNLTVGAPISLNAILKLKVVKGEDNYDRNQIDSLVATSINTAPFRKKENEYASTSSMPLPQSPGTTLKSV